MKSTVDTVLIVFIVIGTLLGWYAHRTSAAHADVKSFRTRLHGARRARTRAGLILFGVAIAALLAAAGFIH